MGRVTDSADQRPPLAMHGVRLSPIKNLFCLKTKIDLAIKWCVNEFRAYGYKYKNSKKLLRTYWCESEFAPRASIVMREIPERWTAAPYHYDMGRVTDSADQRPPLAMRGVRLSPIKFNISYFCIEQ